MKFCLNLSVLVFLFGCDSYPHVERFHYNDGPIKAEIVTYNSDGKRKATNFDRKGRITFVKEFEYSGYGYGKSFDTLGNVIEIADINDFGNHGRYTKYYSTGELQLKGQFNNGQPDSVGLEYFKSGLIKAKYVYDSGRLLYLKQYSEDSSMYKNILSIKVSPMYKGGLGIGDTLDLEILLEYSDHKKIGLIVGKLDSNRLLVPNDSNKFYFSDSLKFVYKYPIDKKGSNKISGIIEEYSYWDLEVDQNSGDTTLATVKAGAYPFERTFEIK